MGFYFFHDTTRKYIVSMLSIFDNIVVQKSDGRQTVVPIVWGSKERAVMVEESDDMNTSTIYPKMALTLVGTNYDVSRKTNKLARTPIAFNETTLTKSYQYNSVPYNFDFMLEIRTKNLTEYFQIMEQIVPYFNPSISLNINEIPGKTATSISVTLASVDVAPDEDGGVEDEARFITGNLNFILKGNLYMPIKDAGVAEQIEILYKEETDESGDNTTIIGTI